MSFAQPLLLTLALAAPILLGAYLWLALMAAREQPA